MSGTELPTSFRCRQQVRSGQARVHVTRCTLASCLVRHGLALPSGTRCPDSPPSTCLPACLSVGLSGCRRSVCPAAWAVCCRRVSVCHVGATATATATTTAAPQSAGPRPGGSGPAQAYVPVLPAEGKFYLTHSHRLRSQVRGSETKLPFLDTVWQRCSVCSKHFGRRPN